MPGKKLERKGFGKAEPRGLSKVEKKDFPKDELKLQKTYFLKILPLLSLLNVLTCHWNRFLLCRKKFL